MSHDDLKQAAKEAIKEWLDDQFLLFGKWTARTLAALALSGLVYFIVALKFKGF